MSITKQIVEELKKQNLTSIEISNKTNVSMDKIVVYLNRLVKNNTIKRISDKKPFIYSIEKSNIDKFLLNDLKFLMDFFQANTTILQKNNKDFFIANLERFKQIANKLEEDGINND